MLLQSQGKATRNNKEEAERDIFAFGLKVAQPKLGRDNTRNPVSSEKNPPTEWDIEASENIKWRALIGLFARGDRLVKL